MGAANLGKHGRWKAFWRVYAVLAPTLDDFINDYCEAWKLRHTIDKEVIIFIDNDHRLAIPCSGTMDDKALVRHIRVFYNLARARVGIFEFFGAKSTLRIDVVKVRLPELIMYPGVSQMLIRIPARAAFRRGRPRRSTTRLRKTWSLQSTGALPEGSF